MFRKEGISQDAFESYVAELHADHNHGFSVEYTVRQPCQCSSLLHALFYCRNLTSLRNILLLLQKEKSIRERIAMETSFLVNE